MTKTTMARPADTERPWVHIDAAGAVVGRLASRIAMMLMGKHRPTYTPHIDTGDFVVVTNVEKMVFTGAKWDKKVYHHHTGYIGHMVTTPAWKMREEHPDRILRLAVQRMMPKTRLGRAMLKKLKIFAGPEHPHQAQMPVAADVSSTRRA